MIAAVWDIEPEVRARRRGQARAESAHYRDLQLAREVAKELAKNGRWISADDVREGLSARFPGETWPNRNWMGRCFSGPEWEPMGWTRSNAPGSHRNMLRLWKLR